jgi:hypothetical protein
MESTGLLVRTLSGLSVLDQGQVRTNYTAANSGLKASWITALARVGGAPFVASYSEGIFRLEATGCCEKSPDATGAFVVNPNAMLAAGLPCLATWLSPTLPCGMASRAFAESFWSGSA